MKYICNPININYRYQFNADPRLDGMLQICREAADPSIILFKGRYYIFASMILCFAAWQTAYWDSDMAWRIEDGAVDLLLGNASDALILAGSIHISKTCTLKRNDKIYVSDAAVECL